MKRTAEILTASIVAIGDFNPAIFSPDWLERNGLIGREDADDVREKTKDEKPKGQSMLVSHEVTAFETSWFALQILGKQFSLTSKGAVSPALRDLAKGIFDLVPHTPVTAVGLNFMGHFKLETEKDWHELGDRLAPKRVWETLYPDKSAGLQELTVLLQDHVRGEQPKSKDHKRITVQPSNKLRFGIYLLYNDHHEVTDAQLLGLTSAEQVASIINNDWENSWQDSERVFKGLLSLTLGG